MTTANRFSVRQLALIAVMIAAVFAASWMQVPVPTPLGNTRLHMGNVMCLLSGMILGPLPGGLAAGLGSMFFDFTNPLYVASAPFTLVFKFLMAFVCGLIARGGEKRGRLWRYSWIGAVSGALTYVVLYLGKNFVYDYFFLRAELQTALIDMQLKSFTSLTNACIAAVASVPLFFAIRKGLARSHLQV